MSRNTINRNVLRQAVEMLEPRQLLSASLLNTPVVTHLPNTPTLTVSTVPANGDLNPYGVAFVPQGFPAGGFTGTGDVLVSNFNASSNLQGTGTTIDSIGPTGIVGLFYQGPAGLGLTTGLGVLKKGFVVVGNMPTTDGTSATAGAGSIIILNQAGVQVLVIANSSVDGPWDLAVNDSPTKPQIFVSNVLNGTITRLDLKISRGIISLVDSVQIGSGYTHRGDPSALEVGPTGLVFDAKTKALFVASTADEAVYAIPHANTAKTDAGTGSVVFQNATYLHGPLGLTQAPNGDLIVANGDALNADPNQPSELVEFTRAGAFVGQYSIDSSAAAPFGLAISSNPKVITLAAVNDDNNTLQIYSVTKPVPFLQQSVVTRLPATPQVNVSTVPSNGDLNPYGVAFVPAGFPTTGTVAPGDVLVSNFNASSNVQGTGTTIDTITPAGAVSTFYQGPAGLGLTTALGVLKSGFIVVGNMPTTGGTYATAQAGSLIILNSAGQQVLNITQGINGPWDLAVNDSPTKPQIFIANVLSGSIERLDFKISHGTISAVDSVDIAAGYQSRTDSSALELGPTGLVYDLKNKTLFLASTLDEAVYAIHHASTTRTNVGTGLPFYQDSAHLHGPLGLAEAPNGDLIVANGDALNADPNQPSELVELTQKGAYVGEFSIDSAPAAPFGLAISSSSNSISLAAVNDDNNTLQVYTISTAG